MLVSIILTPLKRLGSLICLEESEKIMKHVNTLKAVVVSLLNYLRFSFFLSFFSLLLCRHFFFNFKFVLVASCGYVFCGVTDIRIVIYF